MLTSISLFKTWLNARINAKTERGATMVEYAIMVGLIAVVVFGIVKLLGEAIDDDFKATEDCIKTGNCP